MTWTAFLKRPSTGQALTLGEMSAVEEKSSPSGQAEEKPAALKGFDLEGSEFQFKTQ